MEFVFIVGAVQAFFLTFLAINKKNKSKGDYVLMSWFILLGTMLIAYSLEVMGIEDRYPIFWGLNTSLPMLVGPVTLLYILTYTKKNQKISSLYILNILPYVIFTIIVFIKMIAYSEPTVRENIRLIEDAEEPIFFLFELTRILLGPIYLIVSLFVLRKHTDRIGRYFSYTEEIDLKWLRNLTLMLILIWVTVLIISILANWNDFIPWRLGDNLIYLMVTITVFVNGYFGIRQQIIFSSITAKIDSATKVSESKNNTSQYLNSGLSEKESKSHLDNLLILMRDEQPYLDGKLTLAQVAARMNISTNHLSQVINENLNKNFFDFINGYRVELIKQKMQDKSNSHLTLLGMAYDSGFNSKSSFNSIFKKTSGITPSQYLQSQSA